MKTLSLSNLYEKTGCLPKCAETKYKFNLKKSTPIFWRSNSISSFYLTAESDQVEEEVEYLVYDMQVQTYLNLFFLWLYHDIILCFFVTDHDPEFVGRCWWLSGTPSWLVLTSPLPKLSLSSFLSITLIITLILICQVSLNQVLLLPLYWRPSLLFHLD